MSPSASPLQVGFEDEASASKGSGPSGKVYMVVGIPSSSELIELSLNEEELEPQMDVEDQAFAEQLDQELQDEALEQGDVDSYTFDNSFDFNEE